MRRSSSSLSFHRRAFLGAGLALGATLLCGNAAQAQGTWPSRPVRMVVGYPAGGLADVLIRSLQGPLGDALGQPVIIDNRPGAAGNLAGTEVARNGKDDHTFLVTTTTTESVNPLLFPKMPFDPGKDLQPVALLANSRLYLVTRPTLPVKSVRELAVYARTNAGKVSYGSAGIGTTPHLAGELFKQSGNFSATHVPYRGAAPLIQDLMAGQVDFGFVPGTVFQMVKSGKLNLHGVASQERSMDNPSIPTLAESGFDGVYADTLFGIYAPAGMPVSNLNRMNQEVNRLLALPHVKERFAELGAEAIPLSSANLREAVRKEVRIFAGIVKANNIRAD